MIVLLYPHSTSAFWSSSTLFFNFFMWLAHFKCNMQIKKTLFSHFSSFGLLSPVATSHQNVPRKLLRQSTDNSSRKDYDPCGGLSLHENNQDTSDSSENDDHLLAFPGVILLCCGLMFPCFHAERKEASRNDAASIQRNTSELVLSALL